MSRMYSIITVIPLTDEMKAYLNGYITFYCALQRRVFRDLEKGAMDKLGTSKYASEICRTHDVLKRTVNSILYDMKGRIKAYLALKKEEFKDLNLKITAVNRKVRKKAAIVKKMKPLAATNKLTQEELQKYRAAKKSLYFARNRKNKLIQKRVRLQQQIKEKHISLCFGGKQMFGKQHHLAENRYKSHEKWYHDFVKKRDAGVYYLGSGEETCGNQLLQLHITGNRFQMILLKDKPFRDAGSHKLADKQLVVNNIQFGYMQEELAAAIQKGQPVSYRISRKGRKWYLTAMFSMETTVQTRKSEGVYGVDYNNGFFEVAETNGSGNLVCAEHVVLRYHGTGNRAASEIKEKLSKFVRQAATSGKDIVIEELDFTRKKAKTLPGHKKKYNDMIHKFDYSRYLFWMENLCLKYGVALRKINPAYTSQIGEVKYAYRRKLTIHRAAALVIARRGQGFVDRLAA